MEAKSVRAIITSYISEYKNAVSFDEKRKIIEEKRLILIPYISIDFLEIIINQQPYDKLLFRKYYEFLRFSLSKTDNKKLYKFALLTPSDIYNYYSNSSKEDINNDNMSLEYLTLYNPYEHFSIIIDNILSFKKINNAPEEIMKYTDKLDLIFGHDFGNELFSVNCDYPIYSYNYLTWKFLQLINNFQKIRKNDSDYWKKKNNIFNVTKNSPIISDYSDENNYLIDYSTSSEKIISYDKLFYFLSLFQKGMKNLSNKDHKQNLIKIKIMIFYLQIFEQNRFSDKIIENIKRIIEYYEVPEISSDIIKYYEMYLEDDTPVTFENWDQINPDDYVKIIINEEVKKLQIKHFNAHILNIKDQETLTNAFNYQYPQYLSIFGFQKLNYFKFNDEINKECKDIIKTIFSSDLYIEYFIKYDKRFENIKEKDELIKSICKGKYSNDILDELFDNIFFLPFLDGISGFSIRDCYFICISNNSFCYSLINIMKIIPRIHHSINSIIHEITHMLSLVLYLNIINLYNRDILSNDDVESKNINSGELIVIQEDFSKKYNLIFSNKKKNLNDFGQIIEISFYGIALNEYRLYSSLFYLKRETYNNIKEIKIFRNKFCQFFVSQKNFAKNDFINLIGNENNNIDNESKEILDLFRNNTLIKQLYKIYPDYSEISNFSYFDSENLNEKN